MVTNLFQVGLSEDLNMVNNMVSDKAKKLKGAIASHKFVKNSKDKYSWGFLPLTEDKLLGIYLMPDSEGKLDRVELCVNFNRSPTGYKAVPLTRAKFMELEEHWDKIESIMDILDELYEPAAPKAKTQDFLDLDL